MKIRRALAGAATTAVLAPLALLSAPVAFADGTPGASTATPAPGVSSPAADEGAGPGQSPGAGTPNGITSSTPSASGSPTEGPTGQPADCPNPTTDSQLDTSLSDLPDKIAAGSGWHGFTLTLSNKGEKSLGTVRWGTFFSDTGLSDPGRDRLENHITIQHFDPRTHSWEGLPDTDQGNGYLYGTTEVGPKGTSVLKLRAEIDSNVDFNIEGMDVDRISAQAEGSGRYTDGETKCEHVTKSLDLFTVLKPGSGGGDGDGDGDGDGGNGDDPGEATQDPTGEPAGGDHPQGGPGETPATGDLASTGAGSALPVIALVGGVALVAGAGTVFTVRRRRGGSHA